MEGTDMIYYTKNVNLEAEVTNDTAEMIQIRVKEEMVGILQRGTIAKWLLGKCSTKYKGTVIYLISKNRKFAITAYQT